MIKELKWNPVIEDEDDEENPTVWAAEINNELYGKYCWITFDGDSYNVEVIPSRDTITIKSFKSLAGAKRFAANKFCK